jgi:hypothetical protein
MQELRLRFCAKLAKMLDQLSMTVVFATNRNGGMYAQGANHIG